MSLFDFGKSSTTTTAQPTQEQLDQMAMANSFNKNTLYPAYGAAIQGTLDTYNQGAQGVQNAAQNLASVGSQAQQTLGSTGESALRQGITGMESLFSPDYEANQISAALQPAQAQYQQNLANQQAQFGGTGNLGSARQALAGQQLAGMNQATQASTAAQVQKDIAAQRMATGSNLAQLGQTGVQGAVNAAGVPLTAAQTGLDYYNKILAGVTGTPTSTLIPNFQGTQGSTKNGTSFGISI
jgi:hypothetical protein